MNSSGMVYSGLVFLLVIPALVLTASLIHVYEYEAKGSAISMELTKIGVKGEDIRNSIVDAFQITGRWYASLTLKILTDYQENPDEFWNNSPSASQYLIGPPSSYPDHRLFFKGESNEKWKSVEFMLEGGSFYLYNEENGTYSVVEIPGLRKEVTREILERITEDFEEKTGMEITVKCEQAVDPNSEIDPDTNPIAQGKIGILQIDPWGFYIYANPDDSDEPYDQTSNRLKRNEDGVFPEEKKFKFRVEIRKGPSPVEYVIEEMEIDPIYVSIEGLEDPFLWIKSEGWYRDVIRRSPFTPYTKGELESNPDYGRLDEEISEIHPGVYSLQRLWSDIIGSGDAENLLPYYHQSPDGLSFFCRLEGGHYNPSEEEFECHLAYNPNTGEVQNFDDPTEIDEPWIPLGIETFVFMKPSSLMLDFVSRKGCQDLCPGYDLNPNYKCIPQIDHRFFLCGNPDKDMRNGNYEEYIKGRPLAIFLKSGNVCCRLDFIGDPDPYDSMRIYLPLDKAKALFESELPDTWTYYLPRFVPINSTCTVCYRSCPPGNYTTELDCDEWYGFVID